MNQEILINSIIYFVKNTKYCYKTKLIKLLYHFDFIHYRQTGYSATGLKYSAWELGPVPTEIFSYIYPNNSHAPDYIKNNLEIKLSEEIEAFRIETKSEFNEDFFTRRQLNILKELCENYKNSKAEEMIESTHLKQKPWHKTIEEKYLNAEIDYDLAIDDSEDSLPIETIRERQKETSEVKEFFTV